MLYKWIFKPDYGSIPIKLMEYHRWGHHHWPRSGTKEALSGRSRCTSCGDRIGSTTTPIWLLGTKGWRIRADVCTKSGWFPDQTRTALCRRESLGWTRHFNRRGDTTTEVRLVCARWRRARANISAHTRMTTNYTGAGFRRVTRNNTS